LVNWLKTTNLIGMGRCAKIRGLGFLAANLLFKGSMSEPLVERASKPACESVDSFDDERIGSESRQAEAKASAGTLRGLDWLNFFLADVQTGVGPFVAIYLAGYQWNEERVGLALTMGGIAGISRRRRRAHWSIPSDLREL
jgi:hypothetical protein